MQNFSYSFSMLICTVTLYEGNNAHKLSQIYFAMDNSSIKHHGDNETCFRKYYSKN